MRAGNKKGGRVAAALNPFRPSAGPDYWQASHSSPFFMASAVALWAMADVVDGVEAITGMLRIPLRSSSPQYYTRAFPRRSRPSSGK